MLKGASFRSLVVACISATLVGCGDETGADSANIGEVGVNTDVQVVSAASLTNAIRWDVTDPKFDPYTCDFYDKKPTTSTTATAQAAADCTNAVIAGFGRAVLNQYIEPLAWIREDPELTYVSMRHWCSQVDVTVAVKAAAWDSPSFEGIGFYGHEPTINAAPEARHVFYEKDDPRLARVGEGKLKHEGERVYLYRFAGAGPCEVNGTGNVPKVARLEFKPYMQYEGGHVRWEAVEGNHGLGYNQRWDRSHDLLAP
jgi:hypothetical protein